jgi:hypothetical protein
MFEQVFEHAGGGDTTPAPAGTGSGGGGQMRRYDDPVEVRKGWVSGPAHQGEGPEQFLWHGRLWKVRAVLAHWVETGAWWQQHDDEATVASVGELLVERELWRVEAGRGGPDPGGVFDLSFDWTDGRWQLVGCAD